VKPAEPAEEISRNRALYDALVHVVERNATDGDIEGVLLSAAYAANFAWSAPIGQLSDPQLEDLVVRAVRGESAAPTVEVDRENGRVLHVLTEAYAVGGHTRFARRWMERDSRQADLALTNQTGTVPADLLEAVTAAGGSVHDLRTSGPGLLDRARALNRIMDRADIAVLHTHPYDTVAFAAANLPGVRPPIVLENHADHTYWLGLAAADVISDHRRYGQRICAQLRGVATDRLRSLPLPVDPVPPTANRSELRARLRVHDKTIVGLCVATASKMQPIFGTGFADIVELLLQAVPELVLIIVGPPSEGRWQQLESLFPGRLSAVGLVSDASPLYAAADIYLDSYPISGGTSLLEAAAAGLPVLSLQETSKYSPVWAAEAPGLADANNRTSTIEDYIARVRQLARSRSLRMQRGLATQRSVLAKHSGAGWVDDLEGVYAQAREGRPASLEELAAGLADPQLHRDLLQFGKWNNPPTTFDTVLRPFSSMVSDGLRARLHAAWTRAVSGPTPTLRLRAEVGWESHQAWALRALAMAGTHSSLALSLPPIDSEDDAASLARVVALLSEVGLTAETCGDVSIEPVEAVIDGALELPCTPETLDYVAAVLEYLREDWTSSSQDAQQLVICRPQIAARKGRCRID
jgi:glycosyltransferase involved in cell wall biosynthesis